MKKFIFALAKPFDLQLFAEDGAGEEPNQSSGGDNTDSQDNGTNQDDQKNSPKYTEDDLDRIINRKFAEWNKKKEKEQRDRDEAQRLQNMTDEEKRKHQFETMQRELDTLKNEKVMNEMAKTARGILTSKHINVSDELINNLISDDAETTKKSVDSFVSAFEKAVQDAVTERLKGKPPVAGSTGKKITKEEIMKIKNPRERQKMIAENIDLFQNN
ncbi:DUF4355 domain-containing protein [Faecalitalea cylindroides]|uniref:DUF4355 domain-containing protein n=1 Tax=Faecalitalea cylindroides TaxID=39483 RepID=UPI0026762816|nr:DUF4355 domain-containing protein [Faecalitalea cylindroides]